MTEGKQQENLRTSEQTVSALREAGINTFLSTVTMTKNSNEFSISFLYYSQSPYLRGYTIPNG